MTQSFNWLDDEFIDDRGTPVNEQGTGTLNDIVTTTTTGAPRSVRFVGAAPTATGFATGKAGRRLSVLAVGGPLILANENAGSIAAHRIVTGTGGNVTIAQGGGAELRYDATSERWRLVSGGGSPGGGDLPEPGAGDAGKVVSVNGAEDGYELATIAGGTIPTGTGFTHITAGAQDAAAKLVVNADVDAAAAIAASKVVQATGTGFPHVTAGVLDAASIGESGTGNVCRVNTPTLITPVIGAATGTSVALSSYWSTGAAPALAGAGRMSDGDAIYGKSGASSFPILSWSGSAGGQASLGSGTGLDAVEVAAATLIYFGITGVTRVRITSAGLQIVDPTGPNYYTFAPSNIAADRTLTLPLLTGNDTMVTEAHIQALTNKTLSDSTTFFADESDATKKAQFQCSGISTGTTRTYTLPNTSDTLAVLGLAQTFSALQTFSSNIAVGSGTVATAGNIRGANAVDLIMARNAANSADLPVLATSSGNSVYLGLKADASASVPGSILAYAQTAVTLGIGTTGKFTINSGGNVVTKAASITADDNARCKVYSDIANVQTTDATVTSLFTWTILDEARTLVVAEVAVCISTGASGAVYVRRTSFKRDGGTVTAGTVEDTYTAEDTAALDVTIDNSTSTGRVRVTGVAATTYDWGGVTTRIEVSHA